MSYPTVVFPVNLIHAQATQAGLAYLMIGGHAVNCYGEPRATLDVDLLVRTADRASWTRLLEAEGFQLRHDHENFAQFEPPYGVPWRLDLMLVNADTFAKLAADSRPMTSLGVLARVPSPQHLIALKLHAIRHGPADRLEKDFADMITLARNASLDVNSPAIQEIFTRYGTPELYERFREQLSAQR